MHVLYYDKNYFYDGEEDIEGDVLPKNSTLKVPKEGMITPKFDVKKDEWVESATEEYIDSIKKPPEPSEFEVLQKQVADLYYLIASGGV